VNTSRSKIGLKIHPGGDFIEEEDLVIEPLGNFTYAYKKGEIRGVTSADEFDLGDISIEGVKIEDKVYEFLEDKSGLRSPVFKTAEMQKIRAWANGEKEALSGEELFEKCKNYLELFLDLPKEHHYDVATITAMQSWCRPAVNTVFYLSIAGAFGSGKSTVLEALEPIFYHGKLTGSMTESALKRAIESQKLSPLYDELDVETGTQDSIKYRSIRQGYRKGNPTILTNPDNYELETFDTFSSKAFSMHGDIETALKSRSIPISIAESDDNRLPVINQFKEGLGQELTTELLVWYLENIPDAVARVSEVSQVALNLQPHSENIQEARQEIYQKATQNFTKEQLEFLEEHNGRVTELAFISNLVTEIFDVDVVDSLKESFEYKQEMELEYDENSLLNLLKELIIERFEEREDRERYKNSQGLVWIKNKEIHDDFNQRLKENDLSGVSPQKFKEYKRELGFVDELNHKKVKVPENPSTAESDKKSLTCLLIDKKAKRKLGLLDQGNQDNQRNHGNSDVRRPQHEIVKAASNLECIGFTEGIPSKAEEIEEESGLKPDIFEEVFQRMQKEGMVKEEKPGKFVFSRKLSPENLAMAE
jgi:hypothetical protein